MRSKNSEASTPERAWQYALKLLAARDLTVDRLRDKLRSRDFSAEDAEAAIQRLEADQWISDRRFAERFAQSALASGRFFGARLRLEMRRRGVPADLIDEVLTDLADEHDEADDVRAMLERRFPDFSFAAASDREKRRVLGFLQRRGFRASAIMQVLRNVQDTGRCR